MDQYSTAGGRKENRVKQKRIALIAHDHKKTDLLEWAKYNKAVLTRHHLIATGTTGGLLGWSSERRSSSFRAAHSAEINRSEPRIAEGEIDLVIFIWDPLEPQPHDPDVKALLRIAVVWNVPVACNRATADFMISSRAHVGRLRTDPARLWRTPAPVCRAAGALRDHRVSRPDAL